MCFLRQPKDQLYSAQALATGISDKTAASVTATCLFFRTPFKDLNQLRNIPDDFATSSSRL